jgi:chromosomal replication initiator protein
MQAWDTFLAQQEKELGLDTVNKWLRTLKVIDFDACNLYLQAKDSFQIMWFEEHIRKKLTKSFVNNNNKKILVHISLSNNKQQAPPKTKAKQKEQTPPAFNLLFDDLDPQSSFSNFIESEGNLLAHKLLCKITNYDPVSNTVIPSSEGDLAGFNPIYLYGNEGTGKTHLLMATAHALRSRGLRALYARSQTFTEHVITAIRAGEMSLFRQTYRNIDVLLLDDVHIFSRKGATQEELFHTFNTLHLAGKQIILSAHCSPAELQHIEPRLVSRFEWGIVLPLDPLNINEIRNVIEKKAAAFHFNLQPKVTDFLLTSFPNSTKSVNRALEALILRTHLSKDQTKISSPNVSVNIARHLLDDLIKLELQNSVTPDVVVQKVAEFFGITSEDVLGKGQTRDCVLPRQLAMYFCRTLLAIPFAKIGDIFGRDHTTVMSSVKQIKKGLDSENEEVANPYTSIGKKLKR